MQGHYLPYFLSLLFYKSTFIAYGISNENVNTRKAYAKANSTSTFAIDKVCFYQQTS